MQKTYPKLFTYPATDIQLKNRMEQNQNQRKKENSRENKRSSPVEIIMHALPKPQNQLNLASNCSSRFSASALKMARATHIAPLFQGVTVC
jgi:hypothetical protein